MGKGRVGGRYGVRSLELGVDGTSRKSPLLVVLSPDESKLQNAPAMKQSEMTSRMMIIERFIEILGMPSESLIEILGLQLDLPAIFLSSDASDNGISSVIGTPVALRK